MQRCKALLFCPVGLLYRLCGGFFVQTMKKKKKKKKKGKEKKKKTKSEEGGKDSETG